MKEAINIERERIIKMINDAFPDSWQNCSLSYGDWCKVKDKIRGFTNGN